jgi:hypothetical protein
MRVEEWGERDRWYDMIDLNGGLASVCILRS